MTHGFEVEKKFQAGVVKLILEWSQETLAGGKLTGVAPAAGGIQRIFIYAATVVG